MAEIESLRTRVEQIEAEVRSTTDELSEQRKRLESLESIIRQLEPVEEVDIDISFARFALYVLDAGTDAGREPGSPATSLARVPHVFLTLRRPVDAGRLAGGDEIQPPTPWSCRPQRLSRSTEPAHRLPGTPGNIIRSLRNTIESTQSRIKELKESLALQAE